MNALSQLKTLLLPSHAERDPAFAHEVQRTSRRALRVIGLAEITVPALALLLHIVTDAAREERPAQVFVTSVTIAIGALSVWLAHARWAASKARAAVLGSCFAIASILTWAEIVTSRTRMDLERDAPVNLIVTLFAVVATLPVLPWQILVFSTANNLVYYLGASYAISHGWIAGPLHESQYIALPVLSTFAVALSASNYRRAYHTFLAGQRALRLAEEARRAESRALLAETASSMTRLAAAVSHELNSPLGAIMSGTQTLSSLLQRYQTANTGEKERLSVILRELASGIQAASDRLAGIGERIRRFTNLDRAEIHLIDINRLVDDVVSLVHRDARSEVKLQVRPGELQPMLVNPQLVSTVLSAVLDEAVRAAAERSEITVATHQNDGTIRIDVQNPNRRVPPPPLNADFAVSNGRVAGDWALFGATQMLREVGGQLELNGSGVTVHVRPMASSLKPGALK